MGGRGEGGLNRSVVKRHRWFCCPFLRKSMSKVLRCIGKEEDVNLFI